MNTIIASSNFGGPGFVLLGIIIIGVLLIAKGGDVRKF